MANMLLSNLEALFNEIENCGKIEIISQDKRSPPYDKQRVNHAVKSLKEKYGFIMSDDISDLVSLPVKRQLYWSFESDQADVISLFGGFCIPNITSMIRLPKNKVNIAEHIIENEGFGSEQKAVAASSVYFDTQLRDYGYDTAAILAIDEGTVSGFCFFDRVYFIKLEVSLQEYFEILLLTKGVYYWQYLLCSDEYRETVPNHKKQYLSKSIEVLKSIFPDSDYSMADERLARLNGK